MLAVWARSTDGNFFSRYVEAQVLGKLLKSQYTNATQLDRVSAQESL
jgi:predicted Zn-dependent protease